MPISPNRNRVATFLLGPAEEEAVRAALAPVFQTFGASAFGRLLVGYDPVEKCMTVTAPAVPVSQPAPEPPRPTEPTGSPSPPPPVSVPELVHPWVQVSSEGDTRTRRLALAKYLRYWAQFEALTIGAGGGPPITTQAFAIALGKAVVLLSGEDRRVVRVVVSNGVPLACQQANLTVVDPWAKVLAEVEPGSTGVYVRFPTAAQHPDYRVATQWAEAAIRAGLAGERHPRDPLAGR